MDEKTRDTEGEGNKELIFPRVGYNSVNQANYAVGDLARFCNALKDPYRNQTTLTSTTRDVLDKDIPKPPAWRLVSPKELVEVVVTGAKNVGDPNYIVLNGKACTLPPYVIEEDIMLDNMPGRFRGEPFFGRDEIAALYINLFGQPPKHLCEAIGMQCVPKSGEPIMIPPEDAYGHKVQIQIVNHVHEDGIEAFLDEYARRLVTLAGTKRTRQTSVSRRFRFRESQP